MARRRTRSAGVRVPDHPRHRRRHGLRRSRTDGGIVVKLAEEGGGWRMQPNEHLLDLWGLEEGSARTFVQKRLADFTIRCFLQPLEAPTHAAHHLPRSYIASVKPGYPAKVVFDPFAARARQEGWLYNELATGHDAQAEMPEALCELLLEVPSA